jgi:uncharacterized phage-like protein YoqJ
MIVTFCGHAQFSKSKEHEQKILAFLEKNIGDEPADMYLGGYGDFDNFAYSCCKKYKETHGKISLVFVTPYLNSCMRCQKSMYDLILYPAIEDRPMRYAISYRNKYMIEKADFVVAYVSHAWGGAYAMFKQAKRKCKVIFNLANLEE